MLGTDGAGVGLDVLHRDGLELEAHQVAVGVRGVAGHEVAHLPAVAELLRVAVPGVVEEQAVVRIASVPHDELAHGPLELGAVRIFHQRHGKAVVLQRSPHLPHVLSHPRESRPACGVVAQADHERVALLVKTNRFSGFSLDFHALDPPCFCQCIEIQQHASDEAQRQKFQFHCCSLLECRLPVYVGRWDEFEH